MPKIKIFNSAGKEVGEKNLRDDVFGVEVNPELVHEVMIGIMANERQPYAHTKTRGDVRGGGKKPWKQKGTGRARHGSRRSPIWIGGGITFGPRSDRDYSLKINRRVKQKALAMCLTDKLTDQKLMLVENFDVQAGKTKETIGLLGKLKVTGGKTLLVAPMTDAMLRRSTGNLPGVTVRNAGDLGLLDVIQCEYLVLTPEAADKIEQKFAVAKE
ncbi:MAG: 50S ribosomal protein L4 [Patescibacteria group bacterium]